MFSFNAWASVKIGNAEPLAQHFQQAYEAIWAGGVDHPDVSFEVVDLRPGPHRASEVEDLVKCLAELLLGGPTRTGDFTSTSRLLFVGNVRTLATRERETDDRRSIKHDVEFYIRALQNYGVAHYAGIGPDIVDDEAPDAPIRSALIGIWRYYQNVQNGPAHIQLIDRVSALGADLEVLARSARELPEFQYVGSVDAPDVDESQISPFRLLLEIGVIYQFGKGDRPDFLNPAKLLEALRADGLLTLDVNLEHSSYTLYAEILRQMGNWAGVFHSGEVARGRDPEVTGNRIPFKTMRTRICAADGLAKRSFKLARYDLLRDFARVLGQGTLQRFRDAGTSGPILLVDDEIYRILSDQNGERRSYSHPDQDPIVRLLGTALACAGGTPIPVHVVSSEFVDAHLAMMQADGVSRLLRSAKDVIAFDIEGGRISVRNDLDQYFAILIDPESRRDPCGPVRVQRLHTHLRHQFGPVPGQSDEAGGSRSMPPLLAFSRKESSGYVQQCLNMGASAFVPKTRPYQLLFALSRALRDERRLHRAGEQASQFRILKTLKPHVAAKLLRRSGPSFVHGGVALAGKRHLEDPREKRWIQNLPKADLHYHLGTAIPCHVVELLAMNTAGHFLAGAPDPSGKDVGDEGASPLLSRIADTLALAARLERLMRSPKNARLTYSQMELLAAAASAVIGSKRSLENSQFGLGDRIVRHLLEPNDRCDDAHATAILVAMMASREGWSCPTEVADYLGVLAAPAPASRRRAAGSEDFTASRALSFEMERAREHFHRVACRWNGSCTKDDFDVLAAAAPAKFWALLRAMFLKRIRVTHRRLRKRFVMSLKSTSDRAFGDAVTWLAKNSVELRSINRDEPKNVPLSPLALEACVAVPDVQDGRGLQLYLRGADLLGSAHLQYPENLWLAALAITHDNAKDNVIYSEVRCETTGFTKAGMGAHDSTEMLRHGFNLASLYLARSPEAGEHRRPLPLVRTNILLAAKRHKSEPEARAVVALLETYLERRAAATDSARSRRLYFERFGRTMPPWWRPSDVVGFDLSGDETKDQTWLQTVIGPLAARSSPVTIHAGEAVNAQSIWRAVYELNALRIGHGLRLSEDTALLGYCVREGICMEFCPNSNRYTNRLYPHERRDLDRDQAATPLRYEYPLLYYLSKGMEVTFGTDNRYLHREKQRTLTSEYLTAAELVGGLTRWEVLQIVKAGFKNAFLDKSEVQALIAAVEEEIYRIVATEFE